MEPVIKLVLIILLSVWVCVSIAVFGAVVQGMLSCWRREKREAERRSKRSCGR